MQGTYSLIGVTGSCQVSLGPGLSMGSDREAWDGVVEAPDLSLAPESWWCISAGI